MKIKIYTIITLFLGLSLISLKKETYEPIKVVIKEIPVNDNKFEYVDQKFKVYNRDIKEKYVRKFIDVIKCFNLDTTEKHFNACISQICLESGARQYKKDGNVLISSGNAIGFTQIVPVTAYYYLRNKCNNSKIKSKFNKLGAKDYSFVNDYGRYDKDIKKEGSELRIKIIEWLSDPYNDIIWFYNEFNIGI